jgi:tRNA threonylcarbamoyladenosine biosynthesis protein TsaE
MGVATEVPSPSFTLVQTYGNGTDAIWHADLYRLTHPDEIMELGLEDALGHALCLVEWPERMGGRMPRDALTIRLATAGDGRRVELAGGRDGLLHTIAQHWQERPDAR